MVMAKLEQKVWSEALGDINWGKTARKNISNSKCLPLLPQLLPHPPLLRSSLMIPHGIQTGNSTTHSRPSFEPRKTLASHWKRDGREHAVVDGDAMGETDGREGCSSTGSELHSWQNGRRECVVEIGKQCTQ